MRLKRSTIAIGAVFVITASVFMLPVFRDFDNWGIQDWDQHFFYHAVPRATILEYGQFPLWNPYSCGGMVLMAYPQSRYLSPSFLLVLLFGVVRGIKIEIWLYLIVGLTGMYRLARHYRLDVAPALISAFTFMYSSIYALNLTVGMTWFMSVAYLPWVFLFYLRAFRRLYCALLSGLFLALMFFGGGIYILSITVLFLAVYSLGSLWRGKRLSGKSLKVLAITLLFGFCVGAIKFIPTIEFLSQHPRRITDYSGFSLRSLQYSWLGRDQTLAAIEKLPLGKRGFLDGISYYLDENGMYIGVIPFLLFLLGVGFYCKRRWVLLFSLVLFLWLSFGNRVPLSLWAGLHKLPVFDSMRVAQRFRIIVMLAVSLFAGLGFQAVKEKIAGKITGKIPVQLFSLVVVAVIVADLLLVNYRVLKDAFPIAPIKTAREKEFYQIGSLSPYDQDGPVDPRSPSRYRAFCALYPAFLSNVGTIDAYETARVPRRAIPAHSERYRGEVFLRGTKGEAQIGRWSPNKITVNCSPRGEGYLVINQNYYSGWRVKGGEKGGVGSEDGLLAVRVTPRDVEVEIYYLPTSFIIGAGVTAATLLVSIIMLLRGRS